MKSLVRLAVGVLLLGPLVAPASATFSSLYVFGDGVCTTTNGPGGSVYYGNRYCNGRVWVEVLAQRQGITYESNKNWSYYGHYSSQMVTHVSSFIAPDASNALFIIWCADADFVWNVQNYGTSMIQWSNAINQTLTNYFKAVTNLYLAKGARTFILPNAVDLTKVPFFSNYTNQQSFIRQRTIEFNTAFATSLINQIKSHCPNITIYVPDIFTLFDNVMAHSTNYGMIKPDTYVFQDLPPDQWILYGPGTNYVFWDDLDPTAKFQALIANVVQQLVSPVQIAKITSVNSSNRLDFANLPIGLGGFVDGSTDFATWSWVQDIPGTNAPPSIFLPASGARQFYRLRFPFAWSWP